MSQTPTTAVRITEAIGSTAKVDRSAGVIRGVKLIGFESKNGRTYPSQVLRAAVPAYEGSKVNIDHPPSATDPRRYADRLGVIRSARYVESSGIYGDFHFNPKHPAAEQILWDAENNPEAVGFSHNALLRLGPVKEGKQVIEQIVSVRSMDLVADPATTTSLFESELPMDPVADPAASTPDPKSAMKGAFRQMIMAAVDDESLDMNATMKKIKEIMKAQEKLTGGGASKPDEAPAPEDGEESENFKLQLGLLKQELEQYKSKEKQVALVTAINTALVTEGLDPKNPAHVSELFSKQLLATESEAERLALIKDRAALLGAKPLPGGSPVYRPPVQTTESIDAKSFASRLLS